MNKILGFIDLSSLIGSVSGFGGSDARREMEGVELTEMKAVDEGL